MNLTNARAISGVQYNLELDAVGCCFASVLTGGQGGHLDRARRVDDSRCDCVLFGKSMDDVLQEHSVLGIYTETYPLPETTRAAAQPGWALQFSTKAENVKAEVRQQLCLSFSTRVYFVFMSTQPRGE